MGNVIAPQSGKIMFVVAEDGSIQPVGSAYPFAVQAKFSRPVIVKGTISNPQTGYSQGASIGGKITVPTGLPAGTIVLLKNVRLTLGGTLTAVGSLFYYLFETDPSGTTFTDGSAPTIVSADEAKIGWHSAAGSVASQSGSNVQPGSLVNHGVEPALTVDANGNLYLAFIAGGTFTLTGPRANWRVEVRY